VNIASINRKACTFLEAGRAWVAQTPWELSAAAGSAVGTGAGSRGTSGGGGGQGGGGALRWCSCGNRGAWVTDAGRLPEEARKVLGRMVDANTNAAAAAGGGDGDGGGGDTGGGGRGDTAGEQ